MPRGLKPTSRTMPRNTARNSARASSSMLYTSVSTRKTGTMRWCGMVMSSLMRCAMTRWPALCAYTIARGRSVGLWLSMRVPTDRSSRVHWGTTRE